MKTTIHHNHHIWPCHFEWLEKELVNKHLHTAYEVRGYKTRRFESKELAASFAKKHGKPYWQVWYINGKFKNSALFEELIPGKDC